MSNKYKKVEKSEKVLSEQLLRDKTKKQMQDLHRTMSKSGGDIGEQVRKSEKTKEDKMPNSIYMDNPFGQSKRKIETFEDFCSSARKTFESFDDQSIISTYEGFLPKHLEDMYFWRTKDSISLNDDNWVKGNSDDFLRPMFKNLPNHKDRHPYDVLRSGKFIETKDGKVVGQIDTIRGNMVTLDIIDENNEHQYVDFEVNKLIKKIKNNELKVNSNTKAKDKKINYPWGKVTLKENE